MSAKVSEKRRAPRRPIIESFSLFVVVPKRGLHRLPIHDISESGIGFTIDVEGEDPALAPIHKGDLIEMRLYLNQTLYFPLQVKVARAESRNGVRRIGAEFSDVKSKGYKGVKAFIDMLDRIGDTAELDG